jgi:UDP-GlcNAc:undecaprenyl-phosphate GlcNAc-1-phosphate transferase
MDLFLLVAFLIVLFISELFYFKIAHRYNIVDNPNHRSSHNNVTIRGGGIIFTLSLLIGWIYLKGEYSYFILGLVIISFVSFIDDVKTVSNKIRILFHLIAVALLFYQLNAYGMPLYYIVLAFVFAIGTINAVNFMDGINGITGAYSLLTIVTLYYINKYVSAFIDDKYLIMVIISLLVFNFFNFRTRARCFAGDVGSVSIAFITVFFLSQLIIKTNNLCYLLLLLMYGLDTTTTILFRILRKERIFEAHRTHFYQFLANEKKISHLFISIIYVVLQLIINILVISYLQSTVSLAISLVIAVVLFFIIRVYFEGITKLLNI